MKIVLEFDATGRLVTLLTRHSEHLQEFHPETRLDRLAAYSYCHPVGAGLVRVTVDRCGHDGQLLRSVRRSKEYCDVVGLIG